MSLVKFTGRPWKNLINSDFFDMDHFFNERFLPLELDEPAVNVMEMDDRFEIEVAAPGYSKKNFKVTIDNGCLNISAERSGSKEEKEADYTRKEFSYDSFEKSLRLPQGINEEGLKATYEDGILRLHLSKKEEDKKQKSKVVEVA